MFYDKKQLMDDLDTIWENDGGRRQHGYYMVDAVSIGPLTLCRIVMGGPYFMDNLYGYWPPLTGDCKYEINLEYTRMDDPLAIAVMNRMLEIEEYT